MEAADSVELAGRISVTLRSIPYTHNGGYAEYATARTDFLYRIPDALKNAAAAPLLCAGMIGFRSLRIAEVRPGQNVGLFGFGSSAQLMIPVLQAWSCKVFVSAREERHRQLARQLGAEWVGDTYDVPPAPLDCAVTFAPSGDVVIAALRSVGNGGIVAINGIHLDRISEFDYDSLLWGERQLRSVTKMTREDGRAFLKIAVEIGLRPESTLFRLDQANEASRAQKRRPAVSDSGHPSTLLNISETSSPNLLWNFSTITFLLAPPGHFSRLQSLLLVTSVTAGIRLIARLLS